MAAADGEADIVVPLRLGDDVLLKLAKIAHEADVTMNTLVVTIMAMTLEDYRRARATSRNARQGRYVGVYRGRHLRSNTAFFYFGQPDNSVAWLLAADRGMKLRARRPGYTAKALRP